MARRNPRPEFPIEDGRPAPRAMSAQYPFDKLKVGQNFLVPLNEGVTPQNLCSRLGQAARRFRQYHPERRYVTRTDHAAGGVRLYRIDDEAE